MSTLNDYEIADKLKSLPGWSHEGDEITRVFTFDSFMEGIEFVDQVADAAEDADHHPDIDIRYNNVKIALSSHDAGGITERDFRLASQISALA